MTQIKVHIDTLDFTREGLATKDPIDLTVGEHNEIELVRPSRLLPSPAGMGGFAKNSCFPTPGALSVFLALALGDALDDLFHAMFGLDEDTPARIFQLYGHADPSGDEAGNKVLSEKRAAAIRALLIRDIDAFVALGESEGWGPAEQQVMLRTLQCDPGPIDGDLGPLSQTAVADFQGDYVAGVFHRHADLTPRAPTLSVDGDLGPQTFKALLEAIVVGCSPGISPEQLHPTHPAVGCSEFNQLGTEDTALNRRVTLVTYNELPPHHDAAPCTQGDHAACPFDGRAESGCLWYREHVEDPLEEEFVHQHYDLRWLPLPNGGVLLSALTTLQEGDEVTFEVFQTGDVSGPEDIHDDNLHSPISEALQGVVRGGVAHVVWTPEIEDGGFDPFDVDAWYMPVDDETAAHNPAALFASGPTLRPPVFRVQGGNASALSKPPGQDPHRIVVESDEGAPVESTLHAVGVDVYGRMMSVPLTEGRSTLSGSMRSASEPVIAFDVPGVKFVQPKGAQE